MEKNTPILDQLWYINIFNRKKLELYSTLFPYLRQQNKFCVKGNSLNKGQVGYIGIDFFLHFLNTNIFSKIKFFLHFCSQICISLHFSKLFFKQLQGRGYLARGGCRFALNTRLFWPKSNFLAYLVTLFGFLFSDPLSFFCYKLMNRFSVVDFWYLTISAVITISVHTHINTHPDQRVLQESAFFEKLISILQVYSAKFFYLTEISGV